MSSFVMRAPPVPHAPPPADSTSFSTFAPPRPAADIATRTTSASSPVETKSETPAQACGANPSVSSGSSPSIALPIVPLNHIHMKQIGIVRLVPVELPCAPPPYVDDRNATKQQSNINCSNPTPNKGNICNHRSSLTTEAESNTNASNDIRSLRIAMNNMFSDVQPPVEFSDESNPSLKFRGRSANGSASRPNNTADLNHGTERTLQSLAAEPTDLRIRNRIETMSASNSRLLSQHIVRDPNVMQHFCTTDRGSIVASLIERHGDADGMVSYVMSNFASLVREKGGCIAVLRILQHVAPADRAAAFAQLRGLPDVATHQYSNFVLQYFVEGGQNENGLGTEGIPVQPTAADVCHELINRELSDAQTLRTWSSSKCGSRVVDHVIRNARKADAHKLFEKLFEDPNLVLYLGAHEFGHFNLKTAFELLVENAQDEPELLRKYYDIAEPLLRDGRYSRWVFRRAKTSLVLLRAFSQLMHDEVRA